MQNKNKKKIIILTFILMMFVFSFVYKSYSKNRTDNILKFYNYNEFTQLVEKNKVKDIYYNKTNNNLNGHLKDGTYFCTPNPQTEDFKLFLLKYNIDVKTNTNNIFLNVFVNMIMNMGSFIIIIILFSFGANMLMKKQTNIGKLELELSKKNDIEFKDVAGCEEVKENLKDIVDYLKNPKKYIDCGCYMPKGTILYGPPGTGKTLLAKAIAGEANASFIAMSGSDFVEKFVGVGAARIRQVFKKAKENSPCIIFIDEIDAIGKARNNYENNSEKEQTLNQLLVEMDGFNENKNVIVIAATNRLDVLDPALLRSGRFDRQIEVNLPDKGARLEIINYYLKDKNTKDIDINTFAHMTIGMSGADIKNVINEACIFAARENQKEINMNYIDRAINKIIAGDEKKNRKNIQEIDRKITAYHEAGHALVTKLLTNKEIPKVTIVPTTKGAGGYTLITPSDHCFSTKKEMEIDISISLGGRISEELIFGKENITNGASGDIQSLTKKAINMVEIYGMSEVGLVNIREFRDSYSDNFNKELVLKEVQKITNIQYQKTRKLMEENKYYLHKIAKALLNKETIGNKELDDILKQEKESY